jgi:predicted component of type VI protein secretion system
MKDTDTSTLASAMDVLARDIQSDDGVANAAVAEAAQRLRQQHEKIQNLTRALRDAISTYDPKKDVTFVSAERQEAWQEALK